MVHGDCYVTIILYLHRTPAHPSSWNRGIFSITVYLLFIGSLKKRRKNDTVHRQVLVRPVHHPDRHHLHPLPAQVTDTKNARRENESEFLSGIILSTIDQTLIWNNYFSGK